MISHCNNKKGVKAKIPWSWQRQHRRDSAYSSEKPDIHRNPRPPEVVHWAKRHRLLLQHRQNRCCQQQTKKKEKVRQLLAKSVGTPIRKRCDSSWRIHRRRCRRYESAVTKDGRGFRPLRIPYPCCLLEWIN